MDSITERFRAEVLHLICSSLSPSEVRQIRFCCKTLAEIGADQGFQEIPFYLCKAHFEKLRSISQHTQISRRMKRLVYLAGSLKDPPLSLKEYTRNATGSYLRRVRDCSPNWLSDTVPKVAPGRYSTEVLTAAEVMENYRHCLDAVWEQRQILRRGEDFSVLKGVFPKLPSLEEIVV